MRRLGHIAWRVFEFAAALTGGVAIAAVALIWRLNSGPLSLDRVTPWLAMALSDPSHGVSLAIEHAELALDTANRTVNLLANGVHVKRTDGAAEVSLPSLALDLSLRGALRGELAPTRIVLTSPTLRVERAPDGTLHLGLGQGNGDEALAQGLLADLAGSPTERGPFGFLRQVTVRDAILTLNDQALGVSWQAKHVDATVFRGVAGISGDAKLTVVSGDQEADLHSDFNFVASEHKIAADLSIADLDPAHFAQAAAPLALLSALNLPVSGNLRVAVDTATLRVESASADLTVGSGSIDRPELATGSLPIAGGAASLAYDPAAARLTIDKATLDIGGPVVELHGQIDGLAPEFLGGAALGQLGVSGTVILRNMPLDAVTRYWPDQLSPSSRDWVTTHIHDGMADETKADVALTVDLTPGVAKPVQVQSLQGTIAYQNLTIDYFPPLPPARQINGTGTFTRAEFDFAPVSGALQGLQVGGGTVKLIQLDTDNETIVLNVPIDGPLRDVLQIIDMKPLQYAQGLGIDPAKADGHAAASLYFRFPLVKDLAMEQVDFGAKAALKDVAIAGLALGHDLSEGDLQLDLDRNAFHIQGAARIDQVPAKLTWTQSLKAGDTSRHYTVQARLDDAARQRLGFDYLPDYIAGPVDVDLDFTQQKKSAAAKLDLGLTDADLSIARLDWKKPSGIAANAQLTLGFTNQGPDTLALTSLSDVILSGPGIDGALSAALSPADGSLERIDVGRLVLDGGATDVAGSLVRQPAGGWAVTLAGKSLDASHLLSDLGKGAGDESETPLAVTAHIDRVTMGPGREAHNVALRFVDDGKHWQTVVADAVFPGHGKLTVRFGEPAGDHSLKLVSDNLGATLNVIGVTDNVVGGKVTVTGQAQDHGEHRVFKGRVEGGDYAVVQAPMFARLLSVASFSGVSALLSGGGIPFSHLSADYTYDQGNLTLPDARAYGGAMGINVKGSYNLHQNTLDISGTLVPANTLNTVLGNIPLLGNLVQGGEGQGMFAVNFRMAGSAANPNITVNPLSVLAPGFVRKLFLFGAPNPGSSEPEQKEPAPNESGAKEPPGAGPDTGN